MTRQMVMVGFLQAQNCTNLPSSWRHPDSRKDSMSADYYQEIARVLEAGKFHMAFFDDRLDHLFRAVRRRAPLCDPRPDDGRPRGLERRHLAQ